MDILLDQIIFGLVVGLVAELASCQRHGPGRGIISRSMSAASCAMLGGGWLGRVMGLYRQGRGGGLPSWPWSARSWCSVYLPAGLSGRSGDCRRFVASSLERHLRLRAVDHRTGLTRDPGSGMPGPRASSTRARAMLPVLVGDLPLKPGCPPGRLCPNFARAAVVEDHVELVVASRTTRLSKCAADRDSPTPSITTVWAWQQGRRVFVDLDPAADHLRRTASGSPDARCCDRWRRGPAARSRARRRFTRSISVSRILVVEAAGRGW